MRIELGVRDLTRVALAEAPDPLWELASSVRVLVAGEGFGWWRRRLGARLPPSMPVLEWLYTRGPDVPAFLVRRAADVGAGLAAVLGTRSDRLLADLRHLVPEPGLPRWAAELAKGDIGGLPRLVQAMREYFHVAVEPHWATVRTQVDADRALRVDVLASQGVEGLLDSLRPDIEWQQAEEETAGEGLVLAPTYFTLRPELLHAGGSTLLTYPAMHRPVHRRHVPNAPSRALAALLGPTRAAALVTIASGCSTPDLATRLGVTPSAVSKHAAVLRESGLIASRRERTNVVHTVTPLGNALLSAD